MGVFAETSKIKLVVDSQSKQRYVLPFPFDINSCKRSFTTRNIEPEQMKTLISGKIKPKCGDLVLCEVTKLRQHCRIELVNGRKNRMFIKDKIIVCYGNRYAPDQFESIVPENLDACHLVAGGGIASLMRSKSPQVKPATEIQPLGLIGDKEGNVLNLSNYNVLNKLNIFAKKIPPVLLVSGSSMNSGKTTTLAKMINALTADGYSVGAAKVTGTGSGGDLWHFVDSGATQAIDFTDAGYASTYLMANEKIVQTFNQMLDHLRSYEVDIIIIEVADGILQSESKKLLETTEIVQAACAMIFASCDSSSALYGVKWLEKIGYNVIAISGVVSSNPLSKLEVESTLKNPVLTKELMATAGFGHRLFDILKSEQKLETIDYAVMRCNE